MKTLIICWLTYLENGATPMNTASPIELWQFNFSMFPERARWALDFKGIPYRLHTLLPGPHAPLLMRRFGQTSMPILQHGAEVRKQSADVLAYLEARFPDAPALLPLEPEPQARAIEAERWFDAAGEQVRRAGFFELLPHAGYMADTWSAGRSPLARQIYRALFPFAMRPLMRTTMNISARTAEAARARTSEALDRVARESEATGYLIGDAFTLADLTAATVLQLAVPCAECPAPQRVPYPAGVAARVARWASHPGAAYVRRMYKLHRGHSAALASQAA